jgi:hypothetical protein
VLCLPLGKLRFGCGLLLLQPRLGLSGVFLNFREIGLVPGLEQFKLRPGLDPGLFGGDLRVRLKTLLGIAKFSQHEADGRKF